VHFISPYFVKKQFFISSVLMTKSYFERLQKLKNIKNVTFGFGFSLNVRKKIAS